MMDTPVDFYYKIQLSTFTSRFSLKICIYATSVVKHGLSRSNLKIAHASNDFAAFAR